MTTSAPLFYPCSTGPWVEFVVEEEMLKKLQPSDEQLQQMKEWQEANVNSNAAKRPKPEISAEKTIRHGMLLLPMSC